MYFTLSEKSEPRICETFYLF